jgi:hypothetical protein
MAEIKRCLDPAGATEAAKWMPVIEAFTPIDAWPVGSIYIGVTATSPTTLLGGGTWVRFGNGRMMVSQSIDVDFDTVEEMGGTKTHTLTEANLGSHDHTMAHTHSIDVPTTSGMITGYISADHNHGYSATTSAAGSHDHAITTRDNPIQGSAGAIALSNAGGVLSTRNTDTEAAHSHTVSGTTGGVSANHYHTMDHNHPTFTSGGSSAANTGLAGSAVPVNHMPPFIVVYMWKRTA